MTLAISRGAQYSPNMQSSDAAIFQAVVNELEALGENVVTIAESEMCSVDYSLYDHVLTMARDTFQLVMLEKDTSATVQSKFINSIAGIITATNKAAMAIQLLEAGIPQPDFIAGEGKTIIFSSVEDKSEIVAPVWLKNCDGSATSAHDTVYCPTKEAFDEAFSAFQRRGVAMWMAQMHQPGDLIKFYGVEGTNFFSWRYASEGASKFGLEAINGKEKGYTFAPERVKLYADMIAKKLNVPVYGGDVIVSDDGEFSFIDFNDFPSFSSCRAEAAKAIAHRVVANNL